MNNNQSNYAHCDGLTPLSISPNLSYAITGGDDAMLKVFSLQSDSDPIPVDYHPDAVTAVAAHNYFFVSGSEDQSVAMFNTKGEFQSILCRLTMPIRTLSINTIGIKVAIGSDELDVKVVDIESKAITTLQGHSKNLKVVAFHPRKEWLASLGMEGNVRIWDIGRADPPCLKVLQVGKIAEECAMEWVADGDILSVSVNKEVILYETKEWNEKFKLNHNNNVIALASSGNNLATADVQGLISVWNGQRKIKELKHSAKVCGLKWNGNGLVLTDQLGRYTRIPNVIDTSSAAANATIIPMQTESNEFGNMDDLLDDAYGSDDLDDFIVDKRKEDYAKEDDIKFGKYDDNSLEESNSRIERIPSNPVRLDFRQPAFQPGQTEYRQDRKYFAFNMTGVMYTIDEHSHSTVHIEFHDKSAHRDVHITDDYGYDLGALSDDAYVLAYPPDETRGGIAFQMFGGLDALNWEMPLVEKEEIVAITLCEEKVIAATSSQLLRIITFGGHQKSIHCLNGPPVSLAGCLEQVFVVYHYAYGIEDQLLAYSMIDIENGSISAEGTLPMTAKSELLWIGYTESGFPAAMDSFGVLRVCKSNASRPLWTPIFDGQVKIRESGKADVYWPVAVSDTQLFHVLCKGGERFPRFPTPLIDQIDLTIPVLNASTNLVGINEKRIILCSSLGDSHDRGSLKKRADIDKLSLHLMQNACKTNKPVLAFDICRELYLEKSLDAAIKLASFHGMQNVVEKISRLRVERQKAQIRVNDIVLNASNTYVPLEVDDDLQVDSQVTSVREMATKLASSREVRSMDSTMDVDDEVMLDEVEEEEVKTIPASKPVVNPFAKPFGIPDDPKENLFEAARKKREMEAKKAKEGGEVKKRKVQKTLFGRDVE